MVQTPTPWSEVMPEQDFFQPGRNCWRLEQADRVAFLVDGEAYFSALASALEQAREAVWIIGWDIDSRIRLRRGKEPGKDERLGAFLDRLAASRPDLHIYLLEWDFAVLYAFEREFLPVLSLDWQTHPRVRFELDASHPVGASHHQKLVVIDDRLAFVGGFDLACNRWDTPVHAPDDPRRRDNGAVYPPFHDVQMAVTGAAAKALGELARSRWERATGEQLAVPEAGREPWPEGLKPALEQVPVAILRTEPAFEERPAVSEVRRFYLDAIAAARHSIYIENQYLTAHDVGEALAKSLAGAEGPEVVVVLPRTCSGWLEQGTMGALRDHLLRQLHQADSQGRLHCYYPARADLEEDIINVHAKVLVVDDCILRIGSSNLNNRSLGFDSECDLALEAGEKDEVRQAIRHFRNGLLAEHLGATPDAVAQALADQGSLAGAIDALGTPERGLRPLPDEEPGSWSELLSQSQLVDPERPIDQARMRELLNLAAPAAEQGGGWGLRGVAFGLLLLATLVLAAAWRWTDLGQWLAPDRLLALGAQIRASPFAALLVLLVFLVGSLAMFPVTLLILATALTFGPTGGFALALGGSLLGGLAGFLAGRWLGRQPLRRLGGRRFNRLSHRLARRGWLTMALLRVVPVAPFTVINLMAGATHLSLRDFLLGTMAGMGPGILAIMVFEGGLEQALRNPGAGSLGLVLAALATAVLLFWGGRRWLLRQEEEGDDS